MTTARLLFPVLLLLLLPAVAAAGQLAGIRCGLQPQGVYRVVLDFDAAPRHELVSTADSTQHLIKLPGTDLAEARATRGCDAARIRAVTVVDGDAIMVQTREAMSARLYYLRPFAGRGHRLVLDLAPGPEVARPETATPPPPISGGKVAPAAETAAQQVPAQPEVAPAWPSARAWRLRGHVAAEGRAFLQSAQFPEQQGSGLSLAIEPEVYRVWEDNSISFRPFLRWDQHDSRRTHADLRELLWTRTGDGWELAAGVGKVFWGVTEAYHLVDIINQTDLIENPDGEQKLGQPMIKLAVERDWGTVALFALPGFRERTFPGVHGRLRPEMLIDVDDPVYLDGRSRWDWDWALRWSHYYESLDIGLAHFHGTGREPTLVPDTDGRLTPVYERIDQTSIDAQLTHGDWLWKLEGIRRSGQGSPFWATTAGFEYTLVGVADSAADLGLLLEGMYDSRGRTATTPFNRDVFLGLRWTANDVASTELLVGVIADWDHDGKMFNLEASRRIGQHWKLQVQARGWFDIPSTDPIAGYSDDDYIETTLFRYF